MKLKVSENGNIHVITHDVDLEELFPNNELIKFGLSKLGLFFTIYCVLCATSSVQHLVILGGIFIGSIRYFGVL